MLGNKQSTASNDLLSSSDSKKIVRRGCSLINWLFRQGPDYVRLDTPSPSTGQLFARTLMDVCEDGEQSAPVLVSMIFCLRWPHYFYRIEHFQILFLIGDIFFIALPLHLSSTCISRFLIFISHSLLPHHPQFTHEISSNSSSQGDPCNPLRILLVT